MKLDLDVESIKGLVNVNVSDEKSFFIFENAFRIFRIDVAKDLEADFLVDDIKESMDSNGNTVLTFDILDKNNGKCSFHVTYVVGSPFFTSHNLMRNTISYLDMSGHILFEEELLLS